MPVNEPYYTFNEVATKLNLRYRDIQRAAKAGLFPTYTPFGRRCYVLLSEVIAAIRNSLKGGPKND